MKKLFCIGLVWTIISCGNDGGNNSTTGNDTLGTSPGAIDAETEHPTGVTNQNVISTDTAAMNVQKMSDTTGKQ